MKFRFGRKKEKAKIIPGRQENNRMTVVLGVLCTLFIAIIVYLSYIQIFKAEDLSKHTANARTFADEENTLRGSIADRNGDILAHSEFDEDGVQHRVYDIERMYSHIVGYSYRSYGKTGLEASFNSELLDLKTQTAIQDFQELVAGGGEKYGNDIMLTLDTHLQETAYDLLDGRQGSVILMNPKTGEVYAMASNPTYNVATLEEEWGSIVEDESRPLFNRATMGLYAPGSIFKIITATGILENLDPKETYESTGAIHIGDYTLRDYAGEAHGDVNLKEAFRESVNTYFAHMGMELGDDKLEELAQRYMITKEIPFDIPVEKSQFNMNGMSDGEMAATSIGQGNTLVTPLNMAMMASAIANEGEMVKPFLVKQVISHDGEVLKETQPEVLSTVCSKETASYIKEMMVSVVESGTGENASIGNVTMAGKTGTAENETENEHAWFTGFAPAEDPQLAVVVMLEYTGTTGGKSAAPIARDMVIEGLNTLQIY